MKYRVKQIILLNGSQYIPQRKFLFFWIDIENITKIKQTYDTLDDALKLIEYYDLKKRKKDIVYHDAPIGD